MSQPRHSVFESTVPSHVRAASGVSPHSASYRKFWSGLSGAVMEQIADNWERTRSAYAETRQQHYFSAEFLQGFVTPHKLKVENEPATAFCFRIHCSLPCPRGLWREPAQRFQP